jgi:hypothetical protein
VFIKTLLMEPAVTTLSPTVPAASERYQVDETLIDDDHSKDVGGVNGITNPDTLAYANVNGNPGAETEAVGPKLEVKFSELSARGGVDALSTPSQDQINVNTLAASPNRPYGTHQDFNAMNQISSLRNEINASASAHKVSPEAIAGILYQEIATKGADDVKQDQYAAKIANTKPGSPERAAAIAEANSDRSNVSGPFGSKDITRDTTLGDSQISVRGVVELFGGKWNDKTKQYEQIPGAKGYLSGAMLPSKFFADPVGNSMKLLTNPKMAPALVGAWAERAIDQRSGKVRDGGTQYPKFDLNSNRDLHYVFLTGTYSTGGQFNTLWGKGGIDRAVTADPMRYTDLGRNIGPSPGATAALERRERINNLLRGASPDSQMQRPIEPTPRPGPNPNGQRG